jgi:lipid A disaccharide synthetase
MFAAQRLLRRVKYITLVNLLAADELYPADLSLYDPAQPDADRVPFPEYLTSSDRAAELAAHVVEWLTDEAARARRVAQLARLRDQVAQGGASDAAASYILQALAAPIPHPPRPPHFRPQPSPSAGEVVRRPPAP